MARFHLTLAYDGAGFDGWQRNPGRRTVQGVVMEAVGRMAGGPGADPPLVQGASRTDAGVHALGQSAAFSVERGGIEANGWLLGLNALLPDDVAVVACEEVPEGWDPRRAALGKRYRYTLLNRPVRSPAHRRTAWWRRRPLHLDAMSAGGRHLLGEHDFSSFRAAACTAPTPVRTITAVTVARSATDADLVHIDVAGNAFLHKMVRNIVGTLVDVGHGRTAPDAVRAILAARDRRAAGPTAPAHGLTLVAVDYPAPEAAAATGT